MTVRQRFFGMNWEAMHGITNSCRKTGSGRRTPENGGRSSMEAVLQLDEICNELESVRYQAMYLAGAADLEKLFRQS